MKALDALRETWWWNVDPPGKPPGLRTPRPEEETGVVATHVLRRLSESALKPKGALAWADYLLAYGSITARGGGPLELAASGLALLRATVQGRAKALKKELRLKCAMARLSTSCASGDENCVALAREAVDLLRESGEEPTIGLARAVGEEGGKSFGLGEKEFLRRAGGARQVVRRMELICPKLRSAASNARLDEAGKHEAEEILDNVLTLRAHMNAKHKFPEPIDWTTVLDDDIESNVSINHHQHIGLLARAFAATKDGRFAEKARSMLSSWFEQSPCPEERTGLQWRTLEVGGRLTSSWIDILAHLGCEEMGEHVLTLARFIANSGLYLCAHTAGGRNWFQVEASGLYAAGLMTKWFSLAREFVPLAERRLRYENALSFTPDGLHSELSTAYHLFPALRLHKTIRLCAALGEKRPPWLEETCERAAEAIMYLASPDGSLFPLNDCGPSVPSAKAYLEDAYRLFRRKDFSFVARGKGKPPKELVRAMPHSSYYVVRSSWRPDSEFLVFDAGWWGAGHQHEDKLNFVYHAFGRPLVTDTGIYRYSDDEWERYFRGSRGHNSVMVNGLGQARILRTCPEEVPDPAARFIASPGGRFAFMRGEYADGFSTRSRGLWSRGDLNGDDRRNLVTGVRHKRTILWARGAAFLVSDRLPGRNVGPHTFEHIVHLAPVVDEPAVREAIRPGGLRRIEGAAVVTEEEGSANILVRSLDDDVRVESFCGQEDPIRGFVTAWWIVPAWEVAFTRESECPGSFDIVYCPLRAGERAEDVRVERAGVEAHSDIDAVAFTLERPGLKATFFLSHDGAQPVRVGEMAFSAETAAFVFEGEETRASGTWLSRIERSGKTLFRTAHPRPLTELVFPA